MISVISLFLVIIFAIYWWRSRNLPPGPWGLPIVGYLPFLNPKAPYETLTNLARKYGSIYSLSLGSVKTVVISDHKLLKQVFAKDVTTGRAPLYLTHGIMKGYGIVCAQGELWKDQRKFVYGCLRQFGAVKFGPSRTKMENVIMKEVLDMIEFIKSKGKRVILNPADTLKHNLGSAVNKIVFGRSCSRNDEIWEKLLYLQEEGTKLIGVTGPLNFLPFLRFVPKYQRDINFLTTGQAETHMLYQKIIDEVISKEGNYDAESFLNAFLAEREKRKDTTDAEKFYSYIQMHHLLADLFGAGVDTTLATLRWFILFMAVNTDIQGKVHEELNILQGENPTLEDLSSLPLLEACIAETQRIRSVVPLGIPHGALSEFEVNNFKIPKNSMIVPLQWAIHMDPKEWKNPEDFNPFRFIDEEGRFKKHEAFVPFQVGKRMCVGDELARMILFLFGGTIFQHFHITMQDSKNIDLTGECGITLTPKEYLMVFETRL